MISKTAEIQRFLEQDPVLYAGLRQALSRGTAELLEGGVDGVLLRETASNTWMPAVRTPEIGLAWIDRHRELGCSQMVVLDDRLADLAQAHCRFTHRLSCFRAAYLEKEPPELSGKLQMRRASEADFPLVAAHYHMLSEGELREVIRRGQLWIGCRDGEPVGFIGQHLEGSMGLLEIFPEHRKNGYATEMERFMIRRVLENGQIPYCEVETDNDKSLGLQKKLGLTITTQKIYWLF
jgi:RimJ/RimL family protein N-acetyltransferase